MSGWDGVEEGEAWDDEELNDSAAGSMLVFICEWELMRECERVADVQCQVTVLADHHEHAQHDLDDAQHQQCHHDIRCESGPFRRFGPSKVTFHGGIGEVEILGPRHALPVLISVESLKSALWATVIEEEKILEDKLSRAMLDVVSGFQALPWTSTREECGGGGGFRLAWSLNLSPIGRASGAVYPYDRSSPAS